MTAPPSLLHLATTQAKPAELADGVITGTLPIDLLHNEDFLSAAAASKALLQLAEQLSTQNQLPRLRELHAHTSVAHTLIAHSITNHRPDLAEYFSSAMDIPLAPEQTATLIRQLVDIAPAESSATSTLDRARFRLLSQHIDQLEAPDRIHTSREASINDLVKLLLFSETLTRSRIEDDKDGPLLGYISVTLYCSALKAEDRRVLCLLASKLGMLQGSPAYWGKINRDQAELLLQHFPGHYLLRESSRGPGNLALSYSVERRSGKIKVVHRIVRTELAFNEMCPLTSKPLDYRPPSNLPKHAQSLSLAIAQRIARADEDESK